MAFVRPRFDILSHDLCLFLGTILLRFRGRIVLIMHFRCLSVLTLQLLYYQVFAFRKCCKIANGCKEK